MPKLKFQKPLIKSIVTTVGDKIIEIDNESEVMNLDSFSIKRLKKTIGLKQRRIVSEGVCTSDLCVQSAEKIFESGIVSKQDIECVLLVTQTGDYIAPSSAIIIQDRLGLPTSTLAYDINLGCSGFVIGLLDAFSLVENGVKNCLLLVGDVSSHISGERDRTFTPLMGDAGSAILIDDSSKSSSYFITGSDGSGFNNLIIPSGGARQPFSSDSLIQNPDKDGVFRSSMDMYMNGGEVFNFTIKRIPPLIDDILKFANLPKDEVDFFVLHQANQYILKNISKRLGLDDSVLPNKTQTEYGNQSSASIPGTINAYLSSRFSSSKLISVFAGFGIGLSWGACVTSTDSIYCPEVTEYDHNKG
jgi:3-oxoacyl-[acyl-carrier-protein] synthase III